MVVETETETAYKNAKRVAKHVVWLVKSDAEKEKFATVSPDGDNVSILPNKWTAHNRTILARNE